MKGLQISHAVILPGCVQHVLQIFGHQYSFLLISFFFFLLLYQWSQTWWCHWWGGRRGECWCCNQLYTDEDFLMKSEKLLWQEWVTKVSVKFGLQLNTQKEVAAAVGKAELQWAEEQEREKLRLQKWFSNWNIKDRSGGDVRISSNIQPLQNWALHCCFLPSHRRGVWFQWKDDTFPVWNDQAWKSSASTEILFLMQGVFVFAPSHFPHFWNSFLYHCWRKNNWGKQKWKEMPESTEEESYFLHCLFWFCWHSWDIKCFLKESFPNLQGRNS